MIVSLWQLQPLARVLVSLLVSFTSCRGFCHAFVTMDDTVRKESLRNYENNKLLYVCICVGGNEA